MVCRTAVKGQTRGRADPSCGADQVDLLVAELLTQQAVCDLAARIKAAYIDVDVLVNNAGAMFSHRRQPTVLEMTLALNYLNVFLFTLLLLDLLKASAPSRIVAMSLRPCHYERAKIDLGDLQFERRKYSGFGAYGQSKLMHEHLHCGAARRLQSTGVTAKCPASPILRLDTVDPALSS